MKSLNRITLLLIVVAAIVGVKYYADYAARAKQLEMSRQCSADAEKFFDKYRRDWESRGGGAIQWGDLQAHFNGRLNTCLAEVDWSYWLAPILYQQRHVVDVYTRRFVLESIYTINDGIRRLDPHLADDGVSNVDPDKYRLERDQLFSE